MYRSYVIINYIMSYVHTYIHFKNYYIPELNPTLIYVCQYRLEDSHRSPHNKPTGCSGKNVFFTIHCNPSLAYIDVRDLQSSQRNASVQSHPPIGWYSLARERWQTFKNSWKKHTIFDEHPVL